MTGSPGGRLSTGISFEVVWLDDDVVEVRVRAGNGRFSGVADCYASHDTFPRLAAAIHGFPASREDERELLIGTFDPGYAGGGARLLLRCADAAGHVVAEVVVQTDADASGGRPETVSFHFPVEPAAIDDFVAALARMPVVVGAEASLRQAT